MPKIYIQKFVLDCGCTKYVNLCVTDSFHNSSMVIVECNSRHRHIEKDNKK